MKGSIHVDSRNPFEVKPERMLSLLLCAVQVPVIYYVNPYQRQMFAHFESHRQENAVLCCCRPSRFFDLPTAEWLHVIVMQVFKVKLIMYFLYHHKLSFNFES
jgi:hypothetical protein